jgi:hypothetical protein
MKEVFISIFLVISINNISCQSTTLLKVDDGFRNRIFASVGTSFFNYNYLKGYVNATEPLEISVEYGLHKNVTIGFSYATQTRLYQFIDKTYYTPPKTFSYWYHYQAFRLRVVSYLNDFINEKFSANINTDKLKLYSTYMVGLTHAEDNRSWESWERVNTTGVPFYYDITYHFGFTLGVRTNPTKLLGLYLEIGPSEIGLIKAGVSLDIK